MVLWPSDQTLSHAGPTTTLRICTPRSSTIKKMSWDGRVLMQIAERGFSVPQRRPRFVACDDDEDDAMGLRNWGCHPTTYSARRLRRPVWGCAAQEEPEAIGLRNWLEQKPEASALGLAQMAMYRAAQDPEAQLARLEVDRMYAKIQEADLERRLDALKLDDEVTVRWPLGLFPVRGDTGLGQYPDLADCIPVRRTEADGQTWDHPEHALAHDCGVLGEEIAAQSPLLALYSFHAQSMPEELKLERDGETWDHPNHSLAYDCAKLAEEMADWAEYEDWDTLNQEELDFEGGLLEEGPRFYAHMLGELPAEAFDGSLLDEAQSSFVVVAPLSPVMVRPNKQELWAMSYKQVRELAASVNLARKFGTKGQFVNDLLTHQEGWELL